MTSLRQRLRENRAEFAPRRPNTDYSAQDEFLEATADTEMNLRLEDIGYIRLNAASGKEANDLRPTDREAIVKRARLYFQQDAIASRSVKIYTSYCIGRGLSLKGRTPEIQARADALWKNPRNRPIFSFQGQQKSSNKLLVEGEVFFFFFPPVDTDADNDGIQDDQDPDDSMVVRRLSDPLEVLNVISNPEDYEEIWFYDRRWVPKGGLPQRVLYPDHRMRELYPDGLPPMQGTTDSGIDYDLYTSYGIPKTTEVNDSCYVYHIPGNTIGERGISYLLPMMGWTKAHKEFLEDRVAINRALSRFAWFRKIKGAPSQIRNMAGGQPNAGTADLTKLPWNQPAGGVATFNQAVDWQPVNAQSGGASAAVEGKQIRLMAGVAIGLPEHYLGDGSGSNRATATVMERPVQLTFQDYQQTWKEAYEAMFAFEMTLHNLAYDPDIVDVTAPPILEEDSVALASAIVQLAQAMPELKVPDFYRRALESLNIEDTQDILPEIEKRATEFLNLMKQGILPPMQKNTFSTAGRTPQKPGPASDGEVKDG